MGALRKYNVTSNGNRTVLLLTEEDAKLYPDATLVEGQASPTPAKARRTPNKARTGVTAPETKA